MIVTDNLLLTAVTAWALIVLAAICLIAWAQFRRLQFQRALPSAVDLLSKSVAAGESLPAALSSVANKVPEPVAGEFQRMAGQLQLGMPVARAVQGVLRNFGMFELRLLTNTLSLHQRVGGDLAHMLNRLCHVLLERQEYVRQVAAATITAKLSALIIGLSGPLLLIYYGLERNYVGNLLTNPDARGILTIAGILELAGVVWLLLLTRKGL